MQITTQKRDDLGGNGGAYGPDKSPTAKSKQSILTGLISPEFAAMGKVRLKKPAEIQKQQLGILEEINRHWIDRLQSEAKLASEFAPPS